MGKYHPHGDSAIYDTLVADGAGLLAALPARRRPGQLRLDRRRPAGGDAVHGGAPRPARDRDAPRHRGGHRRLRPQLRRVDGRSRWSCRRGSRTCSSTAPPGSPSAWRRTSRRTTSREVDRRRQAPTSRTPRSTSQGLMKHVKGPDFPGGGTIMGTRGDPRRLRARAAARVRVRAPRPHRADAAAARRRSSSPSSRSWSRRAATAA